MNEYLSHHGILGMKWGIRRYQNPDGTYTAEGKKRRRMTDGQQIDDDRYVKNGRIVNTSIEKSGFKLDDNLGGDYYSKKHSSANILIRNNDRGMTKDEVKNALATAKRVEENFKEFNKIVKNAALKDISDYPWIFSSDSKTKFSKNAKITSAIVSDHGTVLFYVHGYDDGLNGHMYEIEFDTKKKKVTRLSLQG